MIVLNNTADQYPSLAAAPHRSRVGEADRRWRLGGPALSGPYTEPALDTEPTLAAADPRARAGEAASAPLSVVLPDARIEDPCPVAGPGGKHFRTTGAPIADPKAASRLDAVRGIVIGLAASAALWVGIAALLRYVWN
jgi:hypothetical protein